MGNSNLSLHQTPPKKEREPTKEKRDLSPSDPFFLILMFAALVGIVYVWSGKKIDTNIQQRLSNEQPVWLRVATPNTQTPNV